jgi:putative hydrolase of the HAD superfamily
MVELMRHPFPIPPVLFFDAVGTLIHPEPPAPIVYAAVGRRLGSRLDEATIAARFRTAFRRQEEADYAGKLRTDETREIARWRAIVREVLDDVSDAEACFQELYAHFACPDAWRCEPETAEVLSTLATRGHVLGIASNFDRRLRGLVESMPPLRPVKHLVISSEIGWRKPALEFFATMCGVVDSPPEQILYVGDDPVNDYEGARTAGMRSLLLVPLGRSLSTEAAWAASLRELLGPPMRTKSSGPF